ncbi:ABC transporter ATP-binding protein [Leucobacter albus]|uniref:ABC transporter ATP-binding protein n=1 Tax=Leucobacter albus TaxID=272210 RepID=A0ABW3TRR4_9MICO
MSPSLPLASAARSRRWLLSRVRPLVWRLLGALLLFVVAAAAGLIFPLALGRLVDAVERDDAGAAFAIAGVALAGLLVAAVIGAAAAVVLTFGLEAVLADIRLRAVAAALGLPASISDGVSAGQLTSRGSDDVDALREAIAGPIPALASSAAAIAMTLAGLFALHPAFLAAVLVVVPVHVCAVRAYLRRAPRLYDAERGAVARRSAWLYEALRSRETIRAYASAARVQGRFSRKSWAVVRCALSIRIVQSRFFLRLGIAEMLGTVALLLTGHALVAAGQATVGEATSALLVMLALFAPMSGLLLVFDDLLAASAALRRVVGVVDAAASAEPSSTLELPRRGPGEPVVALSRATLDLAGVPVIRDVTVEIAPGQIVAIVGASGAGKTSLAKLIAGQLAPTSGRVEVLGRAPSQLPGDAAACLVTVVDQHPHVFEATLAENLQLANPAAGAGAVRDVAERIGLGAMAQLDLSDARTDGALSHRLAVGRALLRQAPVMVFDEATAGVDAAEARELDGLIRAACTGRTVLMIAHRLSQAESCDRVLVMDCGSIVEDGPPEALRAAGGPYARLWEAWAAGAP